MLRRALVAAAATIMVLAGSVAGASAAGAAVTADPCTYTDYSVSNGTTVSFTFEGSCTLASAIAILGSPTIDQSGITGGLGTLLVTITDDGQFVVVTVTGRTQWVTSCDLADGDFEFYLDHVILCSTPEAVAAATPPPDSIQAVGLPAAGSCETVDDRGMDFGTGLTGGWKQSWDYWPNNGAGGAVCTRTLHYSLDLARWVIAE